MMLHGLGDAAQAAVAASKPKPVWNANDPLSCGNPASSIPSGWVWSNTGCQQDLSLSTRDTFTAADEAKIGKPCFTGFLQFPFIGTNMVAGNDDGAYGDYRSVRCDNPLGGGFINFTPLIGALVTYAVVGYFIFRGMK